MKTQDGQSTVKYMEKKRRRKKNPRETRTHTHTKITDVMRLGKVRHREKKKIFFRVGQMSVSRSL